MQLTNNTRTSKSFLNLLTGILSQIIILILNFVVRYVFITKIGYEYLGINSLFSGILTILSVADLGFGSALGIVLYSSLAKKEEDKIAGLMNFFKKIYLIVGIVVTAAGLGLTPFIGYFVNTDKETPNLCLYFLLFLLNTVSSYFISYRAILLRADQKNSVVNNTTTIVKIAKSILEILVLLIVPSLMGLMPTYILYLIVMVLSTYAIGFITSIFAKKKYPYAFRKNINVEGDKKKEIISTTKDLLVYRLSNAVATPIDSIIISLFIGTLVLGVYSNYLLIFTTLMEFICLLSRNVIASVGNFVIERSIDDQRKLYSEMQMLYFIIIVFCTINFVGLVTPFINFAFKPEYQISNWVVFLLGLTLICRCTSELSIIFRETTKIYKKTKYISLFYTGLHIGLSLLFGKFMGLEGILLGNVVAYFCTNFWFELFALLKWYFKENPLKVFLQFGYVVLVSAGLSVCMYYLCGYVANKGELIDLILSALISLTVSCAAIFTLYPLNGFKLAFSRIKNIVTKIASKFMHVYKSKKAQLFVLVAYVVSMTICIMLRDLFAININKFVFFALFVIAVLLSNKKNGIAIILFTLPFSPTLAELYVLIFSLVYFVFISFKNHSIKSWIYVFSIPLLIFILEIVLSSIYGAIQMNFALRIFVLLSLLACIFYDHKYLTKYHLYAFIFGCLYLFVIVAISWLVPAFYGITHKNQGSSWFNIFVLFRECRFGFSSINWMKEHAQIIYPFISENVVIENPNNVALLSITCLVSLFSIYGSSSKKEKRWNLGLIVVFIIFGIWSQSRTFVITFFLLLITFIFVPVLAKRRSMTEALLYLLFLCYALLSLIIFNPSFYQNILKRFSETSTVSGGGRLDLIGDYFSFLFSDWKYALFGVGCSNIMPVSGIDIPPHTNFVQFIVSYGLIFFIIFISLIVFSFIRTKRIKIKSHQIYFAIPIVFTTFFTLTLQLFLPSIILISFIPGVLFLSFAGKNISKEKELFYYPTIPQPIKENSKIKIAMCAGSFGGGISSYIQNISPYLVSYGFALGFVYNSDTTEKEVLRFKNIEKEEHFFFKKKKRTFKPLKLIDKYFYYLRAFEDYHPDIIYINSVSYVRSFIQILAAAKYRCGRIIIHFHTGVNSKFKLNAKERFFRWFVEFFTYAKFACSLETGRVFFGKHFMTKKSTNSYIIPNFINVEKFKFNDHYRTDIRKQLNIGQEDVLLGGFGRLADSKNFHFAIELIEKLPSNYKLVIIGSGPFKQDFENLVRKLNISDRVTLIDNTPEVYKYYSALDYYLLASLREGLPYVGVEAQCSGLKLIMNEELPKGTSIISTTISLPLDIETWKHCILTNKPNTINDRKMYYYVLAQSKYSNTTGPELISSMIKGVIND